MTPDTCKFYQKYKRCSGVCACTSCTKQHPTMPPEPRAEPMDAFDTDWVRNRTDQTAKGLNRITEP